MAALVQYIAWKSISKERKVDNIKCSLFNVKMKWQQTCLRSEVTEIKKTLKTFSMSPLTKWVDLRKFFLIFNQSRLKFLISRETCSHEEKQIEFLLPLVFFHSHYHHHYNHNSAICSPVQGRLSNKKVRPNAMTDNTVTEKR